MQSPKDGPLAGGATAGGKADKKPALNAELWEELLKLLETQEYEIIWVKGHAGHPENERCDQLAVAQSQKFR